MAFCRTKQFEVSPLISGLTPWGHNKKERTNANSLFDPGGGDGNGDGDGSDKALTTMCFSIPPQTCT